MKWFAGAGWDVVIETRRGPAVANLMDCGFAVHSINPKQLDRFRHQYSPAGAKDAWVLAAVLCMDSHGLRQLTATELVELQEWARLANRMREQMWRYSPQFLDAVDKECGGGVRAGAVEATAESGRGARRAEAGRRSCWRGTAFDAWTRRNCAGGGHPRRRVRLWPSGSTSSIDTPPSSFSTSHRCAVTVTQYAPEGPPFPVPTAPGRGPPAATSTLRPPASVQ